MAFAKISKDTHAPFLAALPADPRVEVHKMFGGIAAMVNGNMFAGLWSDGVVVRLSADDTKEALAVEGAEWFLPRGTGKPMLNMVFLPRDVVEDAPQLADWIARALRYTGDSIAPNREKAARKAAKAGGGAQLVTKTAAKKVRR